MKPVVIAAELLPYCALGRLAETVAVGLLSRMPVVVSPLKVQEDFGSALLPQTRALIQLNAKPNFVIGPLGDLSLRSLRDTVVLTMWETDRLRNDCVAWLNVQRAVIVPTEWNKRTFERCGVQVPITVVPLGIDTDVFCPDFQTFPKCVFLTAGRSAHGVQRKGLNTVVLAFLAAFPSETDVVLQVKTHPDCPVLDVNCPRVQIIRSHLCEADLVRWYREGLCFVSGATGEGWGLHQHEAMACGKALVSVNYGGVNAFFQPDLNGYVVSHTLTETDSNYNLEGRCAVPDIADMAHVMRNIYENRYGTFLCGLEAARSVSELTTENMLKAITNVINTHLHPRRRPGRHDLRASSRQGNGRWQRSADKQAQLVR